MFKKAHLEITFWYFIATFAITSILSGLMYSQAASTIDTEYERIGNKISAQFEGRGKAIRQRMILEDARIAKRLIAAQLISINGFIALASVSVGYFLAGKTLEPLQKSLDKQKRFVSDAAHELKTPLTALKTSLEVNLMDKKLSNSTRKVLEENLEDITSLHSLTENLLNLARAEKQYVIYEPTSVKYCLTRAVKLMQPLATKKHITITQSRFPSNLKFLGDEKTFVDLFSIFLDNAIKYSPSKSKIRIKVEEEEEHIIISFIDQGIGIEDEDISLIFDRFYRTDRSRSKSSASGHGLGLSVAQKTINDYNSTIEVTSIIDKGTTFTLTLPKP